MSVYDLSKLEKKTLKRMEGKNSVPEAEIYNCDILYREDYIKQNHTDDVDGFGRPEFDGTYRLADRYWRYVESKRWFNTEYVISHILIPIFVSLATFFLTALLTGVI